MKHVEIIDHIFDLIAKQRWGSLDRYLAEYDLHEASELDLVALLRTPFAARVHLPRYQDTVDKARLVISQRGLDPTRLLRGLY